MQVPSLITHLGQDMPQVERGAKLRRSSQAELAQDSCRWGAGAGKLSLRLAQAPQGRCSHSWGQGCLGAVLGGDALCCAPQVANTDVGWTLGYMLNLTNLIPAEGLQHSKGHPPSLWAGAVSFIVLATVTALVAILLQCLWKSK